MLEVTTGTSPSPGGMPWTSSIRPRARAVRDGSGLRRGLIGPLLRVRLAAASSPAAPLRRRGRPAAAGFALAVARAARRRRPAAPQSSAPTRHRYTSPANSSRTNTSSLQVAEPAELPRGDRPGEDEHGLQVEDHEEEGDLVELDREPLGQRPRRLDARTRSARASDPWYWRSPSSQDSVRMSAATTKTSAAYSAAGHTATAIRVALTPPPSVTSRSLVNVLYATTFPW